MPSLWREQDAAKVRLGFAQRTDRANQRFGFEDHSRTATKLHVIHLAVTAFRVFAEVVDGEFDIARVERAPDDTDAEGPGKHLGKDGEHVEPHHTVSSVHGVTVTVPAATSTEVT